MGIGWRSFVFAVALAGVGSGCLDEEPYDRRCDFVADGDGMPSTLITFSRNAGLFTNTFELSVQSEAGGTIRYTLDGCAPDEDSKVWDDDLRVEESTEVRIAVFDSGEPTPPRATRAYLLAHESLAFDSNLPVVVVETWGQDAIDEVDGSRPHRPAYMLIYEPGDDGRARSSDPPAFAGRIGMHIRGNSTAEEYPKKQYKVETWGEFDGDLRLPVLGMPVESDWVFHAPHSDKTFMRNHLVYAWSNRIGRWASRTRFVEAYINWEEKISNGDYVGIYVWMEKIKVGADRVDVTELRGSDNVEPAVTGGYLLRRDWDAEEFGVITETYEDALLIEDPDPDEITSEQRQYILEFLNEFERALAGSNFDDPDAGYEAYVDVGAFIDHHLLVELARNVDGFVLSTYMSKDRDAKLHMGPVWDYNGSLGNADYFEAWDPEGWHHEIEDFPFNNPHGYRWYERMFDDPTFRERYAARWQELRAGPLANDMLLADIDDTSALLGEAAERNFDRWKILGKYVWPNDDGHEDRESYGDEVDYLRDWLLARVAWMDSQLQ